MHAFARKLINYCDLFKIVYIKCFRSGTIEKRVKKISQEEKNMIFLASFSRKLSLKIYQIYLNPANFKL